MNIDYVLKNSVISKQEKKIVKGTTFGKPWSIDFSKTWEKSGVERLVSILIKSRKFNHLINQNSRYKYDNLYNLVDELCLKIERDNGFNN
jgi:hypothetical protein